MKVDKEHCRAGGIIRMVSAMKAWFVGLLTVAMLAGCATNSMKGTPFYTGEYEVREGPASDRVNIWPIAYYRDPALSVLWPIMEFSPDHIAVRPVYSVYERESNTPIYNVVWPLARFDTKNDKYRIFPFYWGDDYFTAFPLYWHEGDPLSEKGHDALFPLWIWNNSGAGTSLHVFWPLYAKHDHAHHQGWRLWPLFGTRDRFDDTHTWWLWPLGHAFEKEGIKGHGFAPFYFRTLEDNRSTVITFPYSRSLSIEPGEKSWDLALPLWYRGWEGTTNSWALFPTLSWGLHSPEMKDNRYALGLIRSAEDSDSRSHQVLPFYYSKKTPEENKFYSLPWWSVDHTNGFGWNASFPFYYGSHSPEGSVAVTPIYARKKHADGSPAWSCYVPLIYFDRTKDRHFMTLLGGSWQMGDEKQWIALPILSGGRSDDESGQTFWVAGLGGKKWDTEGQSHWLLPIYHSAPAEGRFFSAFYSTWPEGTAQRSMIPILLSGQKVDGDYALKFGALGLVMWEKKGEEYTKTQLIPFYAWQKEDSFYTAVYGRDTHMKYYLTPLVGRYAGDDTGNWIWPLYRHKNEPDGDVDGRYLLLGSYSKTDEESRHGFWGIYRYRDWNQSNRWNDDSKYTRKRHLDYLLIGKSHDNYTYEKKEESDDLYMKHVKDQHLFPLWISHLKEDVQEGTSEASSAWLLALYDSRSEKSEEHSYLRRRVLWKLWHYEKLNGDSATDIFPGITVDRYKNGYYKCSLFWRFFRYENDPESGKKKLDLFFIPFKR